MVTLGFGDFVNLMIMIVVIGYGVWVLANWGNTMKSIRRRLDSIERVIGDSHLGTNTIQQILKKMSEMQRILHTIQPMIERPSIRGLKNGGVLLFDQLRPRLSRDDILNLTFELRVEKEWGGSVTKDRMLREVIVYLDERKRLDELKAWVALKRPDIE